MGDDVIADPTVARVLAGSVSSKAWTRMTAAARGTTCTPRRTRRRR